MITLVCSGFDLPVDVVRVYHTQAGTCRDRARRPDDAVSLPYGRRKKVLLQGVGERFIFWLPNHQVTFRLKLTRACV
jgi:hypothetical protein